MADRPWLGLCARIASSTASIKALTKWAGLPIIIGVPRQLSDPQLLGNLSTLFTPNATQKDIVQWDYGSWPGGLPKKDGATALSGAGSVDTATTWPSKTSRTKNLIIELVMLFFQLTDSAGVSR